MSGSGGRYRYQLSILPIPGLWISVSIAIGGFVDTSIPTFNGQKLKSAWFLQEKKQTALTKPLTLTYSSPKTTYNPNPSPKNRHLGFCSLPLLSVHHKITRSLVSLANYDVILRYRYRTRYHRYFQPKYQVSRYLKTAGIAHHYCPAVWNSISPSILNQFWWI